MIYLISRVLVGEEELFVLEYKILVSSLQSVHDVILAFAVLLQMEGHFAALRHRQKSLQLRILEFYVKVHL